MTGSRFSTFDTGRQVWVSVCQNPDRFYRTVLWKALREFAIRKTESRMPEHADRRNTSHTVQVDSECTLPTVYLALNVASLGGLRRVADRNIL